VTRPARSLKTVGVGLDQRANTIDDRGLAGKGLAVTGQHVEQRSAVHGSGERGAGSMERGAGSKQLCIELLATGN
jgi:hypothetical protein